MRGPLEFIGFLAVATASHLAVFSQAPQGTDAAAGNAGEKTITLAASSTSLNQMVARWDRPVDAVQQIALPQPAPPTPPQVEMPRLAALPEIPRQPSAPRIAPPPADRADLPRVDTSVPPPREAAVTQSKRPQLRPAKPQQTKPRTAKPAQSTPRQTASGSGRKQAAGNDGAARAPVAAPKKASNRALMAQWGSRVRAAVERRKSYPSGTRNRGTVKLSIAVSTRGALSGVSVQRSSGDAVLDRAAIRAVQRARFPKAPRGLPAGVHRFSLPITFSR